MQLKAFEVGAFGVNTYLLWDEGTKQAAIVDPSFGSEGILGYIQKAGLTLDYIINTHGHVDHVYNNAYFKKNAAPPPAAGAAPAEAPSGPPILIHEGDVALLRDAPRLSIALGARCEPSEPDRLIADGDTIAIGDGSITVIHTPGHSSGGVCLHWDGHVIVGDTLFAGSIGRTDLGGNFDQLISSVRTRLFVLPDSTRVYPGHGPATTIGNEKRHNPFFAGRGGSGLWLP